MALCSFWPLKFKPATVKIEKCSLKFPKSELRVSPVATWWTLITCDIKYKLDETPAFWTKRAKPCNHETWLGLGEMKWSLGRLF